MGQILWSNDFASSDFAAGIRTWSFCNSWICNCELLLPMIKLGVNIDHIATLRQARYADLIDSPNSEPDILAAASACERAGASGITVHLRADRRHIQDRDVFRLRDSIMTKLNLEMGNTAGNC